MTRLRRRLEFVLAERESGYVAVFIALCLPLLVGMCALAVDVASWQVEGAKAQKAADSAALAGTIYLPASEDDAFSTAVELAQTNGYSLSAGDVVTPERTSKPTQLRVTITTTVNNAFGVIFGRDDTRITRTSVADYAGPIPMGSPCNILGNELMESPLGRVASSECDDQAGAFWMNIAGTNTNKARGDGYSSGYCTNPNPAPTIDECTRVTGSGSSPTGPITNRDYDGSESGGYLYGVRVTRAGIDFDIQGYDLSWLAQGDKCTEQAVIRNSWTIAPNPDAPNRWVTDGSTRYFENLTDPGGSPASPFCAGDSSMGTPEGDGGTPGNPQATKVRTIVSVFEPSLTPWNPLDAVRVCRVDIAGWDSTTRLATALNGSSAGYEDQLAEFYRRWASVCRINGAKLGDYTVQIRTVGGGGQNRFAMRVDAGTAANQVSMFAAGKTSFFNSVPAGTSTFYLARLDSGAAGKVLNVDFFDLADATEPVTVTVLQPDSNQPFANCRAAGPPISQFDDGSAITDCTIVATPSRNNGRWVRIKAPVPQGYRCSNDSDLGVCWVRVRLNTTDNQNDTTTWRATLEGDPVRIVE